jgi:Zn-dependent M28 family amino/carboxypeptidase
MLTLARYSSVLGLVALSSIAASCGSDDTPGPGNGVSDASDPMADASNPPDDASAPPSDSGDPTPDGGDLTGVDRFRHICMTQGTPITHVRELTMAAGARLAGSPGDAKAVAWAIEHMKAIGLQNVRAEPVTVPHWERGAEHAELLGATETPLAVAALGGSMSTPPGGLEGEVIMAASVSALNALPASQVEGKIVFINQITERSRTISGYSSAVGARTGSASAAANKGAIASIVRSITPAMDNFPHTGGGGSATLPSAAISVQGALELERAIQAGPTRIRLTLESTRHPSAMSANVIGEVVGRERPEDIVVIGGHLDAWDLASGALDDGAGVAMSLESARLLATQVPEGMVRTTRVVLWANEEFGTSGASAYASAHQAELARHVIALEADLGGDVVYGVTFQAGSAAANTMRDLLAPLMPLGIAAATPGGSAGTDVGALRRAGVPVAELLQDMTTYFDYHHAGNDNIDAVDPDKLKQATCAMAVFAYQIGRSTADLGRLSGAAFTSHEDEH